MATAGLAARNRQQHGAQGPARLCAQAGLPGQAATDSLLAPRARPRGLPLLATIASVLLSALSRAGWSRRRHARPTIKVRFASAVATRASSGSSTPSAAASSPWPLCCSSEWRRTGRGSASGGLMEAGDRSETTTALRSARYSSLRPGGDLPHSTEGPSMATRPLPHCRAQAAPRRDANSQSCQGCCRQEAPPSGCARRTRTVRCRFTV